MSTKRGSVASARATPRRRSSPWASDPAGASVVGLEPEQLEQLVAHAGAPPAAAPRRRARRPRRSRGRRARGTSGCAGTFARARLGRAGAGSSRVTSSSVELDVPARRQVEAGDDVDERRLAGAVRPDQADDLVPVQLERDVVERAHARRRSVRRRRPGAFLRASSSMQVRLPPPSPRSSGRPWP